MHRFSSLFLLSIIIWIGGCQKKDLGPADISDNYIEEVQNWKEDRVNSLTSPTGWLRLSGLYWLNEGENSFGSGEDQDIQFPIGSIPEHAGLFMYEDGQVTMHVAEGVRITYEGEPVSELKLFENENEEARSVQHENLEWFVIKRGDLVGVRLFNKENSQADQFTGVEPYPIDPKWNRKARFIPNPEDATLSVINVLGQEMDVTSPGILEFRIGGEIYTLDTIESGDSMFIIVGDQTNQTETYPAGRYLYVDYPEQGSQYTQIDFNKLYNPPCAFTVYSTCQLPPPQNKLELAITAGEKRADDWDGLHNK